MKPTTAAIPAAARIWSGFAEERRAQRIAAMIPAATPYTSARRTAGRSGRDRARAVSPAMRARSDAPGPGGAVLVRVPVASHSRFARDTSGSGGCCCVACCSSLLIALVSPQPSFVGAAVLDWRLDTTGTHSAPTGPLPWLPGVPHQLAEHPVWGPYLLARQQAVTDTAAAVQAQAAEFSPTSAPGWARALVGENPDLLGELAVWRAATGVDPADRRLTGPEVLPTTVRHYQKTLDAQVHEVLGDPHAAAQRWTPLANSIDERLASDPYWLVLAGAGRASQRGGSRRDRHRPPRRDRGR